MNIAPEIVSLLLASGRAFEITPEGGLVVRESPPPALDESAPSATPQRSAGARRMARFRERQRASAQAGATGAIPEAPAPFHRDLATTISPVPAPPPAHVAHPTPAAPAPPPLNVVHPSPAAPSGVDGEIAGTEAGNAPLSSVTGVTGVTSASLADTLAAERVTSPALCDASASPSVTQPLATVTFPSPFPSPPSSTPPTPVPLPPPAGVHALPRELHPRPAHAAAPPASGEAGNPEEPQGRTRREPRAQGSSAEGSRSRSSRRKWLEDEVAQANAVPLPAALDTASFRAAWQDWCEHRTRLAMTAPGKFWNARAAGNTLLECARNGAERSIRAIERSVANGWQGLIWQRLTISIPREPRAVPMGNWRSAPERLTEPAPDSIPEPPEPTEAPEQSIAAMPPQPNPVWRPRLEPLPPPCQWTPKPRPRNPLDDLPPLDSQAFIAGLRGHSQPPPHQDAPSQTKCPETSAEDVIA